MHQNSLQYHFFLITILNIDAIPILYSNDILLYDMKKDFFIRYKRQRIFSIRKLSRNNSLSFLFVHCVDLFVAFYNQSNLSRYTPKHNHRLQWITFTVVMWHDAFSMRQWHYIIHDDTKFFSKFGSILIQFKALTVSEYIAEILFTSYLYQQRLIKLVYGYLEYFIHKWDIYQNPIKKILCGNIELRLYWLVIRKF